MDTQTTRPSPAPEIAALQQVVEVLQRQLDAALEREKASRKREAVLLDLLRQRHPEGISGLEEDQDRNAGLPRGSMRPRIIDLLQKHPQGMTRRQIEEALSTRKHLKHTLIGMCSSGLLVRNGIGVYAVPPPDTASRS